MFFLYDFNLFNKSVCTQNIPLSLQVKLVGEGADDAGGVFDDTITEMCVELTSGVVPLLVPTPNAVADTGCHRDRFLLNPELTAPHQLSLFKFLGGCQQGEGRWLRADGCLDQLFRLFRRPDSSSSAGGGREEGQYEVKALEGCWSLEGGLTNGTKVVDQSFPRSISSNLWWVGGAMR